MKHKLGKLASNANLKNSSLPTNENAISLSLNIDKLRWKLLAVQSTHSGAKKAAFTTN